MVVLNDTNIAIPYLTLTEAFGLEVVVLFSEV